MTELDLITEMLRYQQARPQAMKWSRDEIREQARHLRGRLSWLVKDNLHAIVTALISEGALWREDDIMSRARKIQPREPDAARRPEETMEGPPLPRDTVSAVLKGITAVLAKRLKPEHDEYPGVFIDAAAEVIGPERALEEVTPYIERARDKAKGR